MIIDTGKTVMGQKIFDLEKKPVKGFAEICRHAAADGAGVERYSISQSGEQQMFCLK